VVLEPNWGVRISGVNKDFIEGLLEIHNTVEALDRRRDRRSTPNDHAPLSAHWWQDRLELHAG
jgi:hypothetical protein